MLITLIKNFKSIDVDGKPALEIDLEKATSFEKNVYVTYLEGILSAEDIFSPSSSLYQSLSMLMVDVRGQPKIIAKDYSNSIEECAYLCSLYNVVVLSDKRGCFTGRRLVLENKEVKELTDSKSVSQSTNFYTHAGVNTVIKHLEDTCQQKLIDLAFTKQEMRE